MQSFMLNQGSFLATIGPVVRNSSNCFTGWR